jgi:hypothetical protein
MLRLYNSPVREGLKEVLSRTQRSLLISSPYIKVREADWVCNELARKNASPVRLQLLTDVRSENVLNGSLDIKALTLFAEALPNTTIVNLPRIHAKVYIADSDFALVTSANLTPAGLDNNFEYGVGVDDTSIVSSVRNDLEAYARLGNILSTTTLDELVRTADDISFEYRRLQKSAGRKLRKRFSEKLRSANYEFLRAQVGTRSAHSLFSEAIIYSLSLGPLPTRQLHPKVQSLLPDLCDDSTELVIDGEFFGKKWKHAVRNAQQYLKRVGKVSFDGKVWALKD